MLKSKRSQAKIQEMSFMLIGLTIFFLLVLLFYITITMSDVKEIAAAGSRENAILLVSRLADSPEFACSSGRTLCIDEDKAISLMKNRNYASFWPVDKLEIEKTYPDNFDEEVPCSAANYPDCNIIEIVPNKTAGIEAYSTPVSVCRKEYQGGYNYEICSLGKITASPRKI